MRKWLLAGGALMLIAALLGAGAAYYGWRVLNDPLAIDEAQITLDIPAGTPFWRVSAQLHEQGLLRHPLLLRVYARYTGDATRIHAGEYAVPRGTTARGLLEKLVAGQVMLHQVTIIEGWRFSDLMRALEAHPAVRGTTAPEDVMAALGKADVHPEGQFLPDTYSFSRGTTDVELLRIAHRALIERLERAWEQRSASTMLTSPYEALIMASIIEKETALDSERRLIAGVFNERLRRGMRLQTDPTVIYGMGERFDGDIRTRDLSTDTPYNTYTRGGLPPTPIALPSGSSIDAAVDPEESEALYFVATGLPDGSHYFSATLDEHNAAVARYLERVRGAQE